MAYVLIGFMGAGKSTAARELAAALGSKALDSDALLERQLGHSVAEEFEVAGEAAFRAREEALVGELLAAAGAQDVIALGGGSVLSASVREALGQHTSVLLEISPQSAWERVQASGEDGARPLAASRAQFDDLYAQRLALYEQLADAIVAAAVPATTRAATDGIPRALGALAAAPGGTRMLWARSASGEYPVLVGSGLLGGQEGLAESIWPLARERSRPFCVSDDAVASLYGARLGELAGTIAIAPGERSKTLASAERVWQELVLAGITRADHVVALGGGVVGDLAGFCAATYQRGVPVVQVPTTLVAQVDSAYGGKTGVDLPQAKNYVGAYHQPAGVIVDPDTLHTLPAEELAAGWVEVLKTALIAGGALWDSVSSGAEVDAATILACVRTKLAVVAEDERDAGAAPGAQPRPHPRTRHRGRHRLRALPPRRSGGLGAARRAAPVRARSAARAGARPPRGAWPARVVRGGLG